MKRHALILVLGILALNTYAAETPSLEELWSLVQKQQEQIQSLTEELEQSNSQIKETQVIAISVADAIETQSVSGSSVAASWAEKTSIGGYGEHHYNIVDGDSDQVDAHRYVIYAAHQYSDSVRFFSEFELEHSLAGEGQPGEVELEQAFIEWQFSRNARLTAGQFLIPVGLINETHEPDTFYGVERNKVEAEVVPATWWETGLMLSGTISEGFSYDAAVHSGLNVQNFRIRSGRQKSAEAVADDLAYTARLKYTAIPGLELASSLQYQTDIAQSTLDQDASAILLSAHAVYQGESFGLRALYAAWDIDNIDFEAIDVDQPSGWYIEPSYKLNESVGFFARYSEVDPSRGDRATQKTELVDIGMNYWLTPQVVFKADYQDSKEDGDDSFNLGMGWSF